MRTSLLACYLLHVRQEFTPRLCTSVSQVVARMVAASAIQSTVRSWLKRRRMVPSLHTAVFAMRAILLIQRWWRWRGLLVRIACLMQVQEAVQLNGETCVLFCFAQNMKQRLEDDKLAKPIFREARFNFDFDDNGQVFVHHQERESSFCDDENIDAPNRLSQGSYKQRPFLPHWIGLFANNSDISMDTGDESQSLSPGTCCLS